MPISTCGKCMSLSLSLSLHLHKHYHIVYVCNYYICVRCYAIETAVSLNACMCEWLNFVCIIPAVCTTQLRVRLHNFHDNTALRGSQTCLRDRRLVAGLFFLLVRRRVCDRLIQILSMKMIKNIANFPSTVVRTTNKRKETINVIKNVIISIIINVKEKK